MLMKRGPNAYKNFVYALQETNQVDALRVLTETRSHLNFPPHHFITCGEINSNLPSSRNGEASSVGDCSLEMQYSNSTSSAEYRFVVK